MPRHSLLRLGLFQLGAGMASVLFLGVLNRVLRVELGVDLFLVGLVLGGAHYLGALAAIPFGYYSDRNPVRGLRRTPYIAAGTAAVCLALVLAPWAGRQLATSAGWPLALAVFGFFLLEGIGTYVAGTAYLALITDRTDEAERGRAVAMVWTLLMFGILAGVFLSAAMLRDYSFQAMSTMFAVGALLVLALAAVALWKQDRPSLGAEVKATLSFRESVGVLVGTRAARYFFAFLVVGLFSSFMQDILLEPFGGEVLMLSIRSTAMFNAYLMVGTIAAMWWGGARLIPRHGKTAVTVWGARVEVIAFALLAVSALLGLPWLSIPAVLILGAGLGLFTVGGVALMMDMTQVGQTGLFVGAWTLAQALAKGPAAIAAGSLHNLAESLGATAGAAYATVFIVEALGLAVAVYLLNQVGVDSLRQGAAVPSTILAQAAD